MRNLSFILLFGISFSLTAQDWLNKLKEAAAETGAEEKAKLDSVDFQFAISVNENSGFLDVEQKGEMLSRGFYSYREESSKTKIEQAREILERAIALYTAARKFQWAESEFQNAKTFMENNGLTNEVIYLRCISSMALVYLSQSKFQQAEEFIEWSLTSAENSRGRSSAGYIANLNSKAKLLQQKSLYTDAEKTFDQALLLGKQRFGETSLQYAILLNNKAVMHQTMGRFDESIEEMKESVLVAQKALKETNFTKGNKSFESRQFLSNLANIYQSANKLADAEKEYLNIKDIYEKRFVFGQKNNPEYANVLNQLGILYIQMGKMDKVEALLKTSSDVYKKKFTEQHPSFAKVTADLGNFYRMQGRNAEAEALLNKALSIRESTLGVNHPDYARSQEDMAILFWKTGRLDKAYMMYRDVMDKTIDFINQYFPPMSEAEKTKYWDITAPRFQRFFNFAIEAHIEQSPVVQDFYDYHIATKAILLNATNKVKEAILKGTDENLKKDYLQWLDQKEQLARLYAYSKEELKEQKIDLADLERKANAMERSLSERSSDFSSGYSTSKIRYTQILSLLTDTEAVVDIVRVRKFDQDFTSESRYVALVLKKGLEMPRLVVLENGNQLESRYARFYRNAIQSKVADEYSYDQYWSKIEPEVSTRKVIYLSPDGVYNQLNLNTLKKPDGDYVLNRYDLVIIGNSKDLMTLKAKKTIPPKKNAFLLGFPDYATADISSLPGTKTEVDAVARLLKASGYQVNQVMEKQATESNVKKLKGPTLVHIATHGYFLQDVEGAGGSVFGVNAENASNNPLLRSGLILAGAGHAIRGGGTDISSNDNGVLTAYEAMNLNLEGTNLVVLSACETGLGDVKSGEGVYGLQRAFLVAGADAMIMSLWKVDDAATQQLMTSFYTNWLKLGNKQKAFKQAQLQLMTKYKDPYYWGAFVMMGM